VDEGINDATDRRKILTAVQKIKDSLPSGMSVWLKDHTKAVEQHSLLEPPLALANPTLGPRTETKSKKTRDRRKKKTERKPNTNQRGKARA